MKRMREAIWPTFSTRHLGSESHRFLRPLYRCASFATFGFLALVSLVGANAHPLSEGIMSRNSAEQAAAIQSLDTLTDAEKRDVVAGLRKALRKDAVSAEKAAQALKHLGSVAEPALPELVEALRYDEESVATAVGQALIAIGPSAISPLKAELNDANLFVRRRAAQILGQFGAAARSAAPALVLMLYDSEYQVHAAAEMTLIQIGEGSIAPLSARLQTEDEQGRRLVLGVLSKLGAPAVPIIVKTLQKDPSSYVRVSAAESLREPGAATPEAVQGLIAGLRDLDEGVRVAAVSTLGQLGDRAKSAAPAVEKLFRSDSDALVRQRAGDALGQLNAEKTSAP